MPYIKQDKRDKLDPAIDLLLNALRELESDDPTNNTEGNLNYVISRIFDRLYVANYRELNNGLGVLLATALEYYRRVGEPLEKQRAYDNGDVYNLITVKDVVEDFASDNKER